MKKTPPKRRPAQSPDDILPEYDFRRGRRNPYASRLAGAQIVVVDPDLSAVFPTAAAVNDALRALAGISRPKRAVTHPKTRTRVGKRAR